MSPRTEVYYLDLANLLLQLGDPEAALRVVARGVETTPCAGSLITKQAEILAARQRYAEALAFLEMKMDSCPDPSLRRLHTSLLNEYGAASGMLIRIGFTENCTRWIATRRRWIIC